MEYQLSWQSQNRYIYSIKNIHKAMAGCQLPKQFFHVLSCFSFNLGKGGGGVPGGVVDGDSMQDSDLLRRGGRQGKQTLLGLGPKLIPPQFIHGGVGGGVHRDDSLISGELNDDDETSKVTSDGRAIWEVLSHSTDSMHSHEFKPHSGQPYKT